MVKGHLVEENQRAAANAVGDDGQNYLTKAFQIHVRISQSSNSRNACVWLSGVMQSVKHDVCCRGRANNYFLLFAIVPSAHGGHPWTPKSTVENITPTGIVIHLLLHRMVWVANCNAYFSWLKLCHLHFALLLLERERVSDILNVKMSAPKATLRYIIPAPLLALPWCASYFTELHGNRKYSQVRKKDTRRAYRFSGPRNHKGPTIHIHKGARQRVWTVSRLSCPLCRTNTFFLFVDCC